ncbi:hypothetical protein AB0M80_36500 [Amycolatopsis sp. NPDC051045]
MTEPDDDVTDPEEFAEEAGTDPTPQEVAEYEELAKKQPPWSAPS